LYQAGARTLCASVHARSAPGVLRAGPRLSARSRAGLERRTAYQRQRCRHAQVRAVQGALWDAYAEVAIYMEVLQVAAAPPPGRGGRLLLRAALACAPGFACALQRTDGPSCWDGCDEVRVSPRLPRMHASQRSAQPLCRRRRRALSAGGCLLQALPSAQRTRAEVGVEPVDWSGAVCSRAPSRHARARSTKTGKNTLQQDALGSARKA